MKADIVIIDYGMGNLRSVQKKVDRLNGRAILSSDPEVIVNAGKLILPGVGHFANGIKKLKESGIRDVLDQAVLVDKKPVLGICLGMQLMAGYSEEGNVKGLGWFDAEVVHFTVGDSLRYKVPHMAWNTTEQCKASRLYANVPAEALFYFVHSYHMVCREPSDILAMTTYDYPFVSAIQKGNMFGTQYHPEKSHDWGDQLFRNFIEL